MENKIKLIKLETMHSIFQASEGKLFNSLKKTLEGLYNPTDIVTGGEQSNRYLYAKGTMPVLLVAHLDTVHRDLCTNINYEFIKTKEGMVTSLSSPQGIGGDDRCGVILILSLLFRCNIRPSVLFTCGEETGGHGARQFTKDIKTLDVNCIIEFDRKGKTDVVCYQDDNKELTKSLEKYGFKSSYGSFSDISIIAPHYGISAVNLSSGYYNAHTIKEFVILEEMEWILNRAYEFLSSNDINKKYSYKERTYSYRDYGYSSYYNFSTRASKADKVKGFKQLNLINKKTAPSDWRKCDYCDEYFHKNSLISLSDGSVVCEDCAESIKTSLGYKSCPCCGCLVTNDDTICLGCGYDLTFITSLEGGEY